MTILELDDVGQMNTTLLSPVVSRALDRIVSVTEWDSKPLGLIDRSKQAFSGGVHQVSGTAVSSDGTTHDWSVVVKIFKSPAGAIMPDGTEITREMAEESASFGYWRREVLASQSDLLDNLPPGLAAPRYFQVTNMGDVAWLWQSVAVNDRPWKWSQYWDAAHRLGMWQGLYLTGRGPLPDLPWLSRGWLRDWVKGPLEMLQQIMAQMDGWQHPLLRAYLAPEELAQLQALWAERDQTLSTLDRLPRTLSHLDAYRANLSWQGDTLTLIDWAFVGLAAAGEEMAAFVGATLLLDDIPLAEAEKLETVALEGYLAGMREAGWHGDPEQVWLAYRNAMPLRYAFISLGSMLRTELQPDFAEDWARQLGRPLPEILQHRASFIRFLLMRAIG
jgi:hypothetical protein